MVEKLTELGVHESVRRGRPRIYDTVEEAALANKKCMRESQIARRQLLKDARRLGLEPPKLKRGRRPLYATEEEAKAAQRAQSRACKERYKMRVERAFMVLNKILGEPMDSDSSDQ